MAPSAPRSFLIIQTAFTGDVILATALIEKLHHQFPDAAIDFLVRKGNEGLLEAHPFLRHVLIWDKKKTKLRNLVKIIRQVRALHFDVVVNVQRFFSSGLITVLSGAKMTAGFDKNPLSFFFTDKVAHVIGEGVHEIDRNQKLIASFAGTSPARPALYPTTADFDRVRSITLSAKAGNYSCVAPTSVWFTKQLPAAKWVNLLDLPEMKSTTIFLLGAPADEEACKKICLSTHHPAVINLAGKLSFLESAALMRDAVMNYVNDSAPMHLASSMNAPVTVVYCSTVPAFGFGPLSDKQIIIETQERLDCRPCGLHGFKDCPLGHFKCAWTIEVEAITKAPA